MHEDQYTDGPWRDYHSSPEERVDPDPALLCVCGYDNTPLPRDSAPDRCEGCGGPL